MDNRNDGIKWAFRTAQLAISFLLVCQVNAFAFASKSVVISNPKMVTEIAEEFELFSPSPYAYNFKETDVEYWSKQQLPETELRVQFEVRQTIRRLAGEIGFKIVSSQGELTAGALSYWSERILEGEHPSQIALEFRELFKTQQEGIHAVTLKGVREAVITDEKQIESLARQYGLFDSNSYAWTFEEGDIMWYSHQGMTQEELLADFLAKATVRELASGIGFRIAGPTGQLTSGELSYWAEFLELGSMTKEQMKDFFRHRVQLQRELGTPEPSRKK